MVEVTEEGVVFCDGTSCEQWIESETTCEGCPIDKLFMSVNKYYSEKSLTEEINVKTT